MVKRTRGKHARDGESEQEKIKIEGKEPMKEEVEPIKKQSKSRKSRRRIAIGDLLLGRGHESYDLIKELGN